MLGLCVGVVVFFVFLLHRVTIYTQNEQLHSVINCCHMSYDLQQHQSTIEPIF